MISTTQSKLSESKAQKRIIIWLIAISVYFLFTYLMDPLIFQIGEMARMSFSQILGEITVGVLICISVAEISLLVDKTLDRSLSWRRSPKRRIFIQVFAQIIFSILFVLITSKLVYGDPIFDLGLQKPKETIYLAQWIATNLATTLTISAINTGDYFLKNWIQMAMEASENKLMAIKHQQAATAAELQALRLQIDPHFIFNNLSVLSEIILEDQQLGYIYAENFAKVYRYLLTNSREDLISVKEELKFLEAYIYLTEKRIGGGAVFNLNVSTSVLSRRIPPMTLQLLVENAIKHNQTIKQSPLLIKIYSENEEEMIVYNPKVPLVDAPVSSCIGLANLSERYHLLSDRPVKIWDEDDYFQVNVPLL